MAIFQHQQTKLYYEVHGSGFPILLFAPGGMHSQIGFWRSSPWDPIETLASEFTVIAMDQRNAGNSTAPIQATDGWDTYTADHIALLDHLGIDRCHTIGGCIGGPYCLGLMAEQPQRVSAAIIQQSIGFDGTNRETFWKLFNDWAEQMRPLHPDVTDQTWETFRMAMFGGDFVYNVSRDVVANCTHPMLVLMGNDAFHPEATSREIAALAPNARLIEQWRQPDIIGTTVDTVRTFLRTHTPT
ncbi:MAG: alpha/beta hydrolase [Gammaproteobacteria bacterium]|nr:alpha/beta hydrolase [Gammaproteobacteria bacterium]